MFEPVGFAEEVVAIKMNLALRFAMLTRQSATQRTLV